MCRTLIVRATQDDGVTPHLGMPDEICFESPDELTPDTPTCTCWIGAADGDGKVLRHTFVETVLRRYLEKVAWGNIIIEVR